MQTVFTKNDKTTINIKLSKYCVLGYIRSIPDLTYTSSSLNLKEALPIIRNHLMEKFPSSEIVNGMNSSSTDTTVINTTEVKIKVEVKVKVEVEVEDNDNENIEKDGTVLHNNPSTWRCHSRYTRWNGEIADIGISQEDKNK